MSRPLDKVSKQTLCWECAKSINSGCSWSMNFVPVEGWEAKETIIKSGKGKTESSYRVISCPEFERG